MTIPYSSMPSDTEVASPCTSVCKLDGNGFCMGCGRSLEEIAAWPDAGRIERLAILARIRQRTPEKR